jgi:predicted MFS family arabinose efflux permease
VIGPGFAGILIATIGTGGAFMLNGISYIAVIAALFQINAPNISHLQKTHVFKAIREGFSYSFSHPIIRMLIIFAGVGSVFGWSYTTDMPLIAQNEFHLGATGLGYMYAATGVGSIFAAFLIAFFSKRLAPMFFIAGGSITFAISIILFSYVHSLHLALPLLAMAGLGLLGQFAMINTRIQSLVKPGLRGRVMSIYVFMFVGLTPFGNFEVGWLSEKFGTSAAIRWNAVVVLIFALYVLSQRKKMRASYREYAGAGK